MSRSDERVNLFVDALLARRRPPRFPAEEDEGGALFAAAALASTPPGADLPSEDFLRRLEARLQRNVAGPRLSRRTVLGAGTAAAAAVLAGVGLDRLAGGREPAPPETQAVLHVPGPWTPVVALAALAPGTAVRFSAGAVEGFVVNHGGSVTALSAVCTHLGCLLRLNQPAGRLDCPCHGAAFALDGTPLNREYLTALPRLESRVRDGVVEVMAGRA
ncbi:MAG: QcrA and Rieske domain-containing protein [Candidatus Dormibacteria bacterium]